MEATRQRDEEPTEPNTGSSLSLYRLVNEIGVLLERALEAREAGRARPRRPQLNYRRLVLSPRVTGTGAPRVVSRKDGASTPDR